MSFVMQIPIIYLDFENIIYEMVGLYKIAII